MAVFDVVFEGGGAKGSAFVGALNALAELGHTTRRLIGTSAGAITATTVAAGYSPNELLTLVTEKVNGKPRFATLQALIKAGHDAAVEHLEGRGLGKAEAARQ